MDFLPLLPLIFDESRQKVKLSKVNGMPSFDTNAMTSSNLFQAKNLNCQPLVDLLLPFTLNQGEAESRPSKLGLIEIAIIPDFRNGKLAGYYGDFKGIISLFLDPALYR